MYQSGHWRDGEYRLQLQVDPEKIHLFEKYTEYMDNFTPEIVVEGIKSGFPPMMSNLTFAIEAGGIIEEDDIIEAVVLMVDFDVDEEFGDEVKPFIISKIGIAVAVIGRKIMEALHRKCLGFDCDSCYLNDACPQNDTVGSPSQMDN